MNKFWLAYDNFGGIQDIYELNNIVNSNIIKLLKMNLDAMYGELCYPTTTQEMIGFYNAHEMWFLSKFTKGAGGAYIPKNG